MDSKTLIKKIEDMKVLGGSPRFYELLLQIADLHCRKNKNYAEDNDPLSNLRECEKMGVPAHLGVAIRLTDKFSRYAQLLKGKKDLVGESIYDTLFDISIYALLSIILIENKEKKKTP
jgi:hypothetical protein